MAYPQLQPVDRDPEACRRLLQRVVTNRLASYGVPESRRALLQEQLGSTNRPMRLYFAGGRPVGLVGWSSGNPLGPTVDLLVLEPPDASVAGYGELLDRTEREIGQALFLYGPVPGLSLGEERELLEARGFRPFARSEMTLDPSAKLGRRPAPPGVETRPVRPEDRAELGALHHRTYRDHFDGYLFLEQEDRVEDSRREVRQILEGRWGAFVADGSRVALQDGRLRGAVLTVRGAEGVLIAQVMVDPEAQGRGMGGGLLTESIEGLRAHGDGPIYLNVTEGNRRAVRLYERLGFVRTLGPSQDWYRAERIPVSPTAGVEPGAGSARRSPGPGAPPARNPAP